MFVKGSGTGIKTRAFYITSYLASLLCMQTGGRWGSLWQRIYLGAYGDLMRNALIIMLPPPRSKFPATTALPEPDNFAKECGLTEWQPGSVHSIPLIWNFMKGVGGCTDKGQIFFWRMEDKPLVSMLVQGWFHEPSEFDFSRFEKKKAIVVGSSVSLKLSAFDHAYTCLLSSWRKEELFQLERLLHQLDEDDMDDRYCYSGGSIRDFLRESMEDIMVVVAANITAVK
ncbi:unnamed protein product [Phytophthora lilii]|uniref:Unnamed protein product n=1 Tax=Phytophthora lilii TaxID=2077276 RepID=A0A9W6TM57_9STRA|nr:unnamed protein product [Phytophthora lilii]